MRSEKAVVQDFPTPEQINEKLVVPEHDTATPVKENEAKFIYDFLKTNKLKRTLEIGFAYGRSASHIVAATRSQHYVMDPFQDHYQGLGMKNMELLGLDSLVHHYPEFSHNMLPKLVDAEEKFDFIFIDGDHKFDGIFIDMYYSDMLVDKGGYLLFHDTWMRSTQLVMSFMDKNRKDYKQIPTPLRNIALYQKISDKDERNGMHFRGFYTFKSLLVHPLIMWMSNGKETPLKKLFMKLKDIVK